MDKVLYDSLTELKEAITNDERVKALNEVEDRLNKDEEVMKLAYLKDMALLGYEDATKHFDKDSNEVKEAQHKLYEAKFNLDSHPLVKEYNQKYQEVRKIYEYINEELFSELVNKKVCR